tara:strand:- start:1377 stop:4868 length:3492 start_codon:yes stop_codon:yes gene_type:complete
MGAKKENSDVLNKYKAHTHKEHIYKIPDTYIGSVEKCSDVGFVVSKNEGHLTMKKETLEYIPGLYKIVDEVIVNAWDQFIRNKGSEKDRVRNIDINVCKDSGRITIKNTGRGIDILMHPEHNIYTVELIFGKLLTSTNYTEGEERVTGGKNGYGAKLANIFSKEFEVETIDFNVKKKFFQKFTNNMDVRHEPILTKIKKSEYKHEYTRVSFVPDFERFKIKGWSKDMINIFKRRAFEIAACCGSNVSVTFNDKVIGINSFKDYTKLFVENGDCVYEKCSNRWEIAVGLSESFQQVSFVNGISTTKGGKHIDYIVQMICKKMNEYLIKKHKINVKANYIKEHLFVFVNCLITNPSFDSQTKDYLSTPTAKFGSKCEISDKCIDTIAKKGLAERVIETYNFKESKLLKKTDGKKKMRLWGIPKLDDANEAGGKKSQQCTLILTEGDSAKAMAVAGLGVVGRDLYGVFPLRGKVINVREKITTNQGRTQVGNNEELNYMKQILGLEQDIKYKDTSKLRYGHILIMTDQDYDGSHIKGLIMNWFGTFWPELLQIEGFIQCMMTPIVKVFKKKKEKSFYSITKYNEWKDKHSNETGWSAKYYKGLGTSTTKEAKEYFKDLKKTTYTWNEENCSNSIDMAFNKERSDDRKEWLKSYSSDNILDDTDSKVPYNEFINRELIHFSNYDLQRSIPSIMDGLKPSQRKILYGCFKRKLTKEIRVAQLAGYISEHTGYHHGEESLNGTIIAMAQTFVGSNNINLLEPSGQFGTRLMGGKDAGSPRYLHTALTQSAYKIFQPSDSNILKYLDDDGMMIEPEFYVPCIPMVLCNGAQGIGTGYSTSIPLYNPIDLIEYIEHKIDPTKPKPKLIPYYKGFKGKISIENDAIITKGIYKIINYKTILITELPIGQWIDKYKSWLDSILVEVSNKSNSKTTKTKKTTKKSPTKSSLKEDWSFIKNYKSQSTETSAHFEIEIDPKVLSSWSSKIAVEKKGGIFINYIEKKFRLTSKISTSNMHLYNTKGIIQKFKSCYDIIDYFYENRAPYYVKRKEYLLNLINIDVLILKNKARFVRNIVDGILDIRKHSKESLNEWLSENSFDLDPRQEKESASYQYLIGMPIYQMTTDMVADLEKSLNDKKKEHENLMNTSTSSMWTSDLETIKTAITEKTKTKNKK